ncbi:MAG: sensor histidine kinase [Vicinamibacterales bacterium]
MGWRRLSTLRAKLTLWYVFAMIVVLTIYAVGVFTVVSRNASLALDELVIGDFQWAAEMVEQRPDGTFAWFEGTGVDDSPWLQVWTPSGELLYRSVGATLNPIPGAATFAEMPDQQIVTVSLPRSNVRLLSGTARIGGRQVVIQVARTDAKLREELRQLLLMLVLGLPLGVAVAGLVGYSIARRALKPIDVMAERARAITADRLDERLPIDNPNEELGRLATVFNETLSRLDSSFQQMRRFTSDVSHELRTPLTAIRSVGEVALRERHHDEGHYRSTIGSMLEEADRLSTLVGSLLSMARAETGQAKLSLAPLDLRKLADDVTGHLSVLAEEKGQDLAVEGVEALLCTGDSLVLRQALVNLVDNAIKYTQVGGRIWIRLSRGDGTAVLDVCDNGPGVAMERPERVFDRFARGDALDPSDASGSGLGLSIARWGVEANGGQLTLLSTGASGSIFRMTLPLGMSLTQRVAS